MCLALSVRFCTDRVVTPRPSALRFELVNAPVLDRGLYVNYGERFRTAECISHWLQKMGLSLKATKPTPRNAR